MGASSSTTNTMPLAMRGDGLSGAAESVLLRGEDGEIVGEVGLVKGLLDRRGEAAQVQLPAGLVHAVAGGDQEAESRGIDEAHTFQVDGQELWLSGGHRLADHISQLRGYLEIDLALD